VALEASMMDDSDPGRDASLGDAVPPTARARVERSGSTPVERLQQSEEALRASERRFQTTFEQAAVGIAHVAADGRFLRINQRFCEIVGYDLPEMLELTFHEITHPDDADTDRSSVLQLLAGEIATLSREKRYRRKDGAWVWVNLTVSLARDACGRPDYFVSVVQDVTERRQAEEALRENEERLRRTFDQAPVGQAIVSLDGRFQRVNAELCRITGYAEDELRQLTFASITHPDDLAASIEETRRLLAGETESFQIDKRYLRKDGTAVWARTWACLIKDAHGTPLYTLPIVEDLTARKRVEQDLHERTEQLLALNVLSRAVSASLSMDAVVSAALREMLRAAHTDLACLFLRTGTRLVLAGIAPEADAGRLGSLPEHRVGECLCGLAVELGQPLYSRDIFDDPRCTWQECRQAGLRSFAALPLRSGDEITGVIGLASLTERDFQAQSRFLETLAGTVSVSLRNARLYAETKRAEEEKDRLQAQLIHAQKMEAIGRLAGGVAHDFNNLLTAILGYAELAMMGLPEGGRAAQCLSGIRDVVRQSQGLTQQILAFSRRQMLKMAVIDLNAELLSAGKMLRRLIGEDVEIETVLQPGLGHVRADSSQLQQVLVNLAVNARDAMAGGGKLTITTAGVSLSEQAVLGTPEVRPGEYVLLTVADSGGGMDAATLSHIFEPFFTTKELGRGTGLGLATVYGIVKQHGGHIDVQSTPGVGTVFRIYLPRVEETADADLPESAPPPVAQGEETILVAEDDPLVRDLTCRLLSARGYRVLSAPAPLQALDLARAHAGEISLLITDIVMPGMNGRELYRRLAAERPGIKVLFMSGYAGEALSDHGGGLEEGLHFLQKPFGISNLARHVRQILDNP
jgi:two-component system cell cycle sensor histidine kinase/response regulator CckA